MIAVLFAVVLAAAEPEVDVAEIARSGDRVQVIDAGHQGDVEHAMVEALGPPKDDNDKWCISVYVKRDEGASARLKADWEGGNPTLTAWGNPHSTEQSWSHLRFYDVDDPTQEFRSEAITFQGFPSVIVQPPRNGAYGPPKAVVMQRDGYDGDATALCDAIRSSIDRYVTTLQSGGGHQQAGDAEAGPPTWTPPPKNEPVVVGPGLQTPSQLVPPLTVLSPSSWPNWLLVGVGAAAMLLVVKGPGWYQSYRTSRDAKEAARLKAMMQQLQPSTRGSGQVEV